MEQFSYMTLNPIIILLQLLPENWNVRDLALRVPPSLIFFRVFGIEMFLGVRNGDLVISGRSRDHGVNWGQNKIFKTQILSTTFMTSENFSYVDKPDLKLEYIF